MEKMQALAEQTAGMAASGPADFWYLLTIFVLAVFVGFYVVWSVTPALHSSAHGGHQRGLERYYRRGHSRRRARSVWPIENSRLPRRSSGIGKYLRRFHRNPAHASNV